MQHAETTDRILRELVRLFQDQLSHDLVGVYLHGSLAMGCFNQRGSDLDILIVSRRRLGASSRQQIGAGLVVLRGMSGMPAKGLELSVVTLEALENFVHPMPFELHFYDRWARSFSQGEGGLPAGTRDPDLAAHIAVTRERGVTLHGVPIPEFFPIVPREAFIDSVVQDAEACFARVMAGPDGGVCPVPTYAVLNFCRLVGYVMSCRILSKAEGGRWALSRVPEACRFVVQQALREYACPGASAPVDAAALRRLAVWARAHWLPGQGKA